MPQREPAILDVVVAELGMVKGARCLSDISCWAFLMGQLGDEWPEGDERGVETARARLFADAFDLSLRTVWRRLEAFRRCFPGELDPTRFVRALDLEVETKADALDAMLAISIGRRRVPS